MAWIESHQSLSRHRKTLHMTAALKTDRHKILGHLHELWWWGLDNADANGLIGHVSAEVIAEASGWPAKDAQRWLDALIDAGGTQSVGFLEQRESGFVLHDWYEFAGKLNDRREANKERMQRARAEHGPHKDPPQPSARAQHVNGTTAARAPATGPNQTGSSVSNETGPHRLRVVGEPVPKPIPKPTPVGTLLDKIKALDPAMEIYGDHGFTGRKLKENPNADLDLIAEAYVAFRHGEWPGSKMLRESGALAWVIGDLGGYVEWRTRRVSGAAHARRLIDRTGVAN